MHAHFIPSFLVDCVHTIRAHGGEAFLVGGAVRDLLQGKIPLDFDLATNLLPTRILEIFPYVLPTGLQHGTVSVWPSKKKQGKPVEITTYRIEKNYTDSRRPDRVEFVSDLEQDLARRDLTINAMAYDVLEQRLIDPFLGQHDLDQGIVRAVGDPVVRFSEDGLRSLRAIRFAVSLDFSIEPNTFLAIAHTLHHFSKVSYERVRDEWNKILTRAQTPGLALTWMRSSGMLNICMPELAHTKEPIWNSVLATLNEVCLLKLDPLLSWAALLLFESSLDNVAQILSRFKFSNQDKHLVMHWLRGVQNYAKLPSLLSSEGQLRRFLKDIQVAQCDNFLALYQRYQYGFKGIDRSKEIADLKQRLKEVLDHTQVLTLQDLKISGRDLMLDLDLPPSPLLGSILNQLLEQVLDDQSLNQKEKLLECARRLKIKWGAQVST